MPAATQFQIIVPRGHEGSAWWRGAVATAEKRARAAQSAFARPSVAVVTVGPPTSPDDAEDRTCDRCRQFVPEGKWFTTFCQQRPNDVYVVGGLCESCTNLEGFAIPEDV